MEVGKLTVSSELFGFLNYQTGRVISTGIDSIFGWLLLLVQEQVEILGTNKSLP